MIIIHYENPPRLKFLRLVASGLIEKQELEVLLSVLGLATSSAAKLNAIKTSS
jgi:hypothetical protein